MGVVQVKVDEELVLAREMVTAAHPEAARAGAEVMAYGGNAVDAAVATAIALGVVDPCNSGIGGYGGYAVIALQGQPVRTVDFNTSLPADAKSEGDACFGKKGMLSGPRSITVPGVLRGLAHMAERYGSGDISPLFDPAIRLARDGFPVSKALQCAFAEPHIIDNESFQQFFLPDGRTPFRGDQIRLPDYANVLLDLQRHGVDLFYRGDLGHKVCRFIRQSGGFLDVGDLENYTVTDIPAFHSTFRGLDLYTAGGGSKGEFLLHLLQNWEIFDREDWGKDPFRAYRQGADAMMKTWGAFRGQKLGHTTHLTVVDSMRNVVALTLTHGPLWFGSGVLVPGTGIVFNNGLNLFRAHDNTLWDKAETNLTPTVIFRNGKPYFALGTPGGKLIPSLVGQYIVNVVDRGMSLHQAVNAPRYHSDQPGEVQLESAFPEQVKKQFTAEGYRVEDLPPESFYGPSNGIMIDADDFLHAAVDMRWEGAAAGR